MILPRGLRDDADADAEVAEWTELTEVDDVDSDMGTDIDGIAAPMLAPWIAFDVGGTPAASIPDIDGSILDELRS